MFVVQLQFVAFAMVVVSLSFWLGEMHVRNRRSWEAIAVRLKLHGPGLTAWSRFRRAGIVVELADFAEYKVGGIDPALPQRVRRQAIAMRLSAARALAGFGQRGRS
ncbi:MAG TPA: hypothetical protein VK716_11255 [Terracidiphilus sp.]|jgi:hypothetical protein|nr:hypothetical protein [Terracidiphilus sp.]